MATTWRRTQVSASSERCGLDAISYRHTTHDYQAELITLELAAGDAA